MSYTRKLTLLNKDNKIQGKCLASWEMMCKPKDQGGLEILNLRLQNQALLMKNLHTFYNHSYIPSVNLVWQAHYNNRGSSQSINPKASFWWKDCLALSDKYKELTTVNIQNGKTVLLWKGNWKNEIRQEFYLHMHSFARNQSITIYKTYGANNENIYDMFHVLLSTVAHEELHNL
jgi:hypothetical protein